MNKDLQIGQRVRLSEDHEWTHDGDVTDYGYGSGNPTNCDGTVDNVYEYWLGVKWDNGYHNSYRRDDSDLIPVDATADSALEILV